MELPFDKETTDFLDSYMKETGISSDEMKKIFNMEEATDEELMAEFTDYEIQMGIDDYENLYEIVQNLLYFKSTKDSENYLKYRVKMEEYVEFSLDKTFIERYMELEKYIFE